MTTHTFDTRLRADGTPYSICLRCGKTIAHDAPYSDMERAMGEECVPSITITSGDNVIFGTYDFTVSDVGFDTSSAYATYASGTDWPHVSRDEQAQIDKGERLLKDNGFE